MYYFKNSISNLKVFEGLLYGYEIVNCMVTSESTTSSSFTKKEDIEPFKNPLIADNLIIRNDYILSQGLILVTPDKNRKIVREILTGIPIPIYTIRKENKSKLLEFCKDKDIFDRYDSTYYTTLKRLKKVPGCYMNKYSWSEVHDAKVILNYQENHSNIEYHRKRLEEAISQAEETREAIISTLETRRESSNVSNVVKLLKKNWK